MTNHFTDPWDVRAHNELSGSIRHIVEVRANHPDWDAPIVLPIEQGTIEYQELRSPFIQAQIAMRIPSDIELALLDPRLGVTLEIDAGYIYNDATIDVHRLANLRLWERTVSHHSDTLTLQAKSQESRLTEWMPLHTSRSYNSSSDAGVAITDLIHWAIPDATVVNDMQPATFVTGADSLNIGIGDNLMQAIYDIADRAIDGWVYEDGLGNWHVTNIPKFTSQSAAIFKTGPNGTITVAESTLSAAEFYNAVVVQHRWYDGEQRTATGSAEVIDGPLGTSNVDRRVLMVSREYTGSTFTARSSASAIVGRTISRGRSISFSAANAPYWLRPGDTITIQLPEGPQERHLVTDVQFDLAATGVVNVGTRLPEDVTIITGE